jgi:hypothetical protein
VAHGRCAGRAALAARCVPQRSMVKAIVRSQESTAQKPSSRRAVEAATLRGRPPFLSGPGM